MKKDKNQHSEDIRNFVAKYMHENGNCGLQIVEDKKRKMKNGEGKHKFDKSRLRSEM